MWVKFDTIAAYDVVHYIATSAGNNEIQLQFNASLDLYLGRSYSSWINLFTPTTGVWYFFAFTKTQGGNIKVWWGAEGSALSSNSVTDSLSFAPGYLRLGRGPNANEEMDGQIAAHKFWNAGGFSDDQILAERYSYVPKNMTSLNDWYPLLSSSDTGGMYNKYAWTTGGSPGSAAGPPVPWNGITRGPINKSADAAAAVEKVYIYML
jgi:hypothetical protein